MKWHSKAVIFWELGGTMYLTEPNSLNSSISKQDIGMNAVLNFEFPSVDMGEAGAADLSAGGKRARDVAVMASARRPVEDFGPFIFATVSLPCSTEAMTAQWWTPPLPIPSFLLLKPTGSRLFLLQVDLHFKTIQTRFFHPALMLLICLAGNKGIAVNRCNCCGGPVMVAQLWWIDRVDSH